MIDEAPQITPPSPPATRPTLTWSKCAILLLLFPITLPLLVVAALRALLAPLPAAEPVAPEGDSPEQGAAPEPSGESACAPAPVPASTRARPAVARPAVAPVPARFALVPSLVVPSVDADGVWARGRPSRFRGG